jgi:hypothetical protein
VSRKFAQITAGILARKGEAVPSLTDGEAVAFLPEKPQPAEQPHFGWAADLRDAFVADITSGKPLPKKIPAKKTLRPRAKAAGDPGTRKLFLKVSARDNERLEIAAVKLGSTRNELLKNAILSYLDELTRRFENRCGCIAGTIEAGETCCSEGEMNDAAWRRMS